MSWRQVSEQGVEFYLVTVWQYSTFKKLDGNSPALGDLVAFLDETPTQTDRLPIQFDFGDASTILTGQREVEAPYTPLCTSNLPPGVTDRCLWGTVRQIDQVEDTVTFSTIVEHEYQFGAGPYYARFTGCCRPDFPSSANNFHGLTNNPSGPWKIAAEVLLHSSSPADPSAPSAGSWPQSPSFFFPSVVDIELAKPLDVPVLAFHPFDSITYRIGTASDYAADLTSTIPADKQGPPPGVIVEAGTGVLKLPSLNEQQLYAIHIIATSAHGASTSIDFYIQVVDDRGNAPPLLSALRVPAFFVCEEETEIVLGASDPDPASTMALSFSRSPLLPSNPAAVASPSAPAISVSSTTASTLTAAFTWESPCESLPANSLYSHRGRHWLGLLGVCFEAEEVQLPPEHLVALAPALRSLPTCLAVPVIRCTTPTLDMQQLPSAEVVGVGGGQWTVLVGTSAVFTLFGLDDSQTLDLQLAWSGDDTGVTVSTRECTDGGQGRGGGVVGATEGCWGGRWEVEVTGSMENAGREQRVCYEAVNDQVHCDFRRRSLPVCVSFVVPPPRVIWEEPMPTEAGEDEGAGEDEEGLQLGPSSSFSELAVGQSNHRPFAANTLAFTLVPRRDLAAGHQLTVTGIGGVSTVSSPPFSAEAAPAAAPAAAASGGAAGRQWVAGSLCGAQSSRLPGALNRIQVQLQPRDHLQEGLEITVSGLSGSRRVCGAQGAFPALDFSSRLWTTASAEAGESRAAALGDLVSCAVGACVGGLLRMDKTRADDLLGIRISGVQVPFGAQITAAAMSLVTNTLRTDAATLRISAQRHYNAPPASGNTLPSAREQTSASVEWVLPAGSIGETYELPDLSPIVSSTPGADIADVEEGAAPLRLPPIQEVVREEYWREGNAIFLLFTLLSSPCTSAVPTPTSGCQAEFLADLASARPTLAISHKCPVTRPAVDLESRAPGPREVFHRQDRLQVVAWNQTTGTITARVPPGRQLAAMHTLRLSLSLHNGLNTQPAPAVFVQTGNATGAFCGLTHPLSYCSSVPEQLVTCPAAGADAPLLLSAWRAANASQLDSTPRASNRIALSLTPALPLDEAVALTVSGITGLSLLDEGSLSEEWGFGIGSAVGFRPGVLAVSSWSEASGVLVIGVNAGRAMHVGREYRFSFALVNGATVQEGGTLQVHVGGLLSGASERVPTTGEEEAGGGAVRDATPLRVRLWEILTGHQMGGVANATTDITIEFQTRASVPGGARVTVSGLEGVATPSGPVPLEYIITNTGQVAIDIFGATGSWNAETKELSLQSSPGLPMLSTRPYVVTFRFMAALTPQRAPEVRVSLEGGVFSAAPEVVAPAACERQLLSLNSVAITEPIAVHMALWRCVQFSQPRGTLAFQSGALLRAGVPYLFFIALRNAGATQPAQTLALLTRAAEGAPPEELAFTADSAENAQPLLIKLWSTKTALQSSTVPGSSNIISISLVATVPLAAGSEITVSGLTGTGNASPSFTPVADCDPPPCLVVTPTFDPVLGRLTMVLKDGETLEPGESLSLAVEVQNRRISQPAQTLYVEASGSVSSQRTAVTCLSPSFAAGDESLAAPTCLPAGAEALATPEGESPPVLLSAWTQAAVRQLSPVPGAANEIVFSLQPATDLAAGDVITISGISGTGTLSAPEPRLSCPGGTIASCSQTREPPVLRNILPPSTAGEGWRETPEGRVVVAERTATECGDEWQLQCALGEAEWDQADGVLRVTVQGGDGGGLRSSVVYEFALAVQNGIDPGELRVHIAVSGSVAGHPVPMEQPPSSSDERVFVLAPLPLPVRAGCEVRQVLHAREGGGQFTLLLEPLAAPHGLPSGAALSYECLAEGQEGGGVGIGGCVEVRRELRWRPRRDRMGSTALVCFEARTEVEGGVRRCLAVEVLRCAYCLQQGESFESLAVELGTSWLQLWGANPHLSSPQDAALYEPLNLGGIFQPLPSDSLQRLAARFSTTEETLRAVNPDLTWQGAGGSQAEAVVGAAPLPQKLCIVPHTCSPPAWAAS